MLLVLCTWLSSCSKDDYVSRIHELIIDDVTFDADSLNGGSLTYVKTFRGEDLSNYKANSDSSWCSVVFDTKAATMTVSVTENNTFEERKTLVILKDTVDGSAMRSFAVTQLQNDVVNLSDPTDTYQVATEGGQVVINLESNVNYSVQIPDSVDWITLSGSNGTRGLQKSSVTLDVAKNTTLSSRSTEVSIVKADDTDLIIKTVVKIEQLFDPYLTIKVTDYTIDERGGLLNIYIQTNVDFAVSTVPDDAWIKDMGIRDTIGDNMVNYLINVASLTAKQSSRTSNVTIENTDLGLTQAITITQTRNLYIEESSINLLSGCSKQLTLYNADHDKVVWTSSDESVAKVDSTGNVTGISAGAVSVTVTSSDGLHSDYVVVSIEKPSDLKDQIMSNWLETFTQYDDVSVLTHLSCTITNNSEFDLTLNKATFYCDGKVLTTKTYDEVLAVGSSKKFESDIAVERGEDTVVTDTTYTEDGTMVIEIKTIPGKAKENTHQYRLVWNYSYCKESFTYICSYPENYSGSRKQYARKPRKR
jgi:uncharacterized protein YjdB